MSRFDEAYRGVPPWDVGRPQPAFVRLEAEGGFAGDVLDVGCGTGETALFLAARSHRVWGVDLAEAALMRARGKARRRGLDVPFLVADALALDRLRRSFDTVLDSGVFHIFDDGDRARYVESLASVLRPGGRYHMLVFSDREPTGWGGPRRIAQAEIGAAFGAPWRIERIREESFHTTLHGDRGGHAWLASLRRAPEPQPT